MKFKRQTDDLIYQIPHFIFMADVSANKNRLGSEPLQFGSQRLSVLIPTT
jgi:hypothetical protein